ncbi:hypothetical protein ABZ372_06785 [Streptomyces sp. NPDC005921]|uniref:hypothetical protein n=1 Tax=Streptomyces sp. NPDC005827 TaxID=3157070 RepID=UPI0033DE80C5
MGVDERHVESDGLGGLLVVVRVAPRGAVAVVLVLVVLRTLGAVQVVGAGGDLPSSALSGVLVDHRGFLVGAGILPEVLPAR